VVAALRKRMSALAGVIGDGVMWANAALSHLPFSLSRIPPARRTSLILSNSAPACVSDDRGAALAAVRRYLVFCLKLPNYQNYFVEAGYEEEVAAARSAIERGDDWAVMAAIPEGMASDVALFGSRAEVLERAEAWEEAGITHLVLDCTCARRSPWGRLRGYGGLRLKAARDAAAGPRSGFRRPAHHGAISCGSLFRRFTKPRSLLRWSDATFEGDHARWGTAFRRTASGLRGVTPSGGPAFVQEARRPSTSLTNRAQARRSGRPISEPCAQTGATARPIWQDPRQGSPHHGYHRI